VEFYHGYFEKDLQVLNISTLFLDSAGVKRCRWRQRWSWSVSVQGRLDPSEIRATTLPSALSRVPAAFL